MASNAELERRVAELEKRVEDLRRATTRVANALTEGGHVPPATVAMLRKELG